MFDIWLIGDRFLRNSTAALDKLLNKNKNNATSGHNAEATLLYMNEFYNVFPFHELAAAGMNSVITRVLNSLIVAINAKPRLSRFLLITLDKDLIAEFDLDVENNVVFTFKRILFWFKKQIQVILRRAQLSISEKKPGAMYRDHPTVIYVKALR